MVGISMVELSNLALASANYHAGVALVELMFMISALGLGYLTFYLAI